MIGGVSRGAAAIKIAAGASRLLDELSQRHRCAAGLRASHSQCRGNSVTSRATTPSLGRPGPRGSGADSLRPADRGGLRQSRNDVAFAAAQIQIERAAVGVVKDENGLLRGASGCLHDGQRDLGQWTGGQPLLADEGGNGLGGA